MIENDIIEKLINYKQTKQSNDLIDIRKLTTKYYDINKKDSENRSVLLIIEKLFDISEYNLILYGYSYESQ